ncbi:MAG: hypothetical protein K8H88_17060, partial [Sandaracinaceae bacterium]|nr:hypothetical protein [Sandaracinaceae bacterium]
GGGSLDAGTRDAGAAPVDAGPRDAGTVTPITATDSAGNSYFRAVAATDTDPRLEVLVGHVAVALSGSAVITVNHPSGSGIIVSVDRVRGLSPGPFVGQTNNGGSGTSVTGAITTFEPALIFAAVGTRHRRVAATPAGWLPGSGQIAACGGAFGNLSINTFAMVARSTGSQPFSTTLDTAELWRLGLVALR